MLGIIKTSWPFIENKNISLDSPLEMYNKFILAYQFGQPNPEISQKMANMAGCYLKLCGYVNYACSPKSVHNFGAEQISSS